MSLLISLYSSLIISTLSETIDCPKWQAPYTCGPCTSLSASETCIIDCIDTDWACADYVLECSDDHPCNVLCSGSSGSHSCTRTNISAKASTDFTLQCTGPTNTCFQTLINAQNVTGKVTVICDGSAQYSCNQIHLICGTGECEVQCDNTCGDVTIDRSLASNFICIGADCGGNAITVVTANPTTNPTFYPTNNPLTLSNPTQYPITLMPTSHPSSNPTQYPITQTPTNIPTTQPIITTNPTAIPTNIPSAIPSSMPSVIPSVLPSYHPTDGGQAVDETTMDQTKDKDKKNLKQNDSMMVYYIIGAIVICCVIGIFVVFIIQRKKKESSKIETKLEFDQRINSLSSTPMGNTDFKPSNSNYLNDLNVMDDYVTPMGPDITTQHVDLGENYQDEIVAISDDDIEMVDINDITPNGYDDDDIVIENGKTIGDDDDVNVKQDEFIVEGDDDEDEILPGNTTTGW